MRFVNLGFLNGDDYFTEYLWYMDKIPRVYIAFSYRFENFRIHNIRRNIYFCDVTFLDFDFLVHVYPVASSKKYRYQAVKQKEQSKLKRQDYNMK